MGGVSAASDYPERAPIALDSGICPGPSRLRSLLSPSHWPQPSGLRSSVERESSGAEREPRKQPAPGKALEAMRWREM